MLQIEAFTVGVQWLVVGDLLAVSESTDTG